MAWGKFSQWLFVSLLHKFLPGGCASIRMVQLHEYSPFQDNEYLQAIKSVGSVLAPYDSDQMIPAFGFGAQIPPHFQVSHCFPLDLNTDKSEVNGVQVLPSSNCIPKAQLYSGRIPSAKYQLCITFSLYSHCSMESVICMYSQYSEFPYIYMHLQP